MDFYDKFTIMCARRGVALSKACEDMGMSPSACQRWKNGSIPNRATIFRIADYFGIDPMAYYQSVTTGEDVQEKPTVEVPSENRQKIRTTRDVILSLLSSNNNQNARELMRTLADATDDQLEFLEKVMRLCDI